MAKKVNGISRVRAVSSLVVICAMVASVLTFGYTAPVAPARPAVVLEAPDEASAVMAARRQGSRVEVMDQRTETRSVFADPRGGMTAELTTVPTRVKQANGWAAIDTTLVHSPPGTVAPRAAVGEAVFSGGGSAAPLARLTKDGMSLELWWPGALPTPVLAGDQASYVDVMPGVDLRMRAQDNGYALALVIKDAQAAHSPALARIGLRYTAPGLRLSVDKSGVLWADNDRGEQVFTAPPPVMSDASGSRSARVGVELGDGMLILVPDQGLLADPATVFPLEVNQKWATFRWDTWGTVLSGEKFRGSSFPRTSADGPNVIQVGKCYPLGGECNDIQIARAYLQFDTGFLGGKEILDATLATITVHSPDCDWNHPQFHKLWRSFNVVNDTTTWDNQPHGMYVVGETNPFKVNATWRCPDQQPVGFPAKGGVNPGGPTTLILQAADENDILAWRKYSPFKGAGVDQDHTKLRVRYDTKPYAPSNMTTDPPLPVPCRWCGGVSYFGDPTIRLSMTLSDPDPGDQLYSRWATKWDDQSDWAKWGGSDPPENLKASGANHDATLDLRGRDGRTMIWRGAGHDQEYEGPEAAGPGPFVMDLTDVTVAPTVSGALYREDNAWHGGIGVPDTFTFGANGVGDIDHYRYSWTDPPSPVQKVDASALGGPATITLAPIGDGPRTLYVQSVDRGGHPSPTKAYRFYVRAGNGPYTQYSFEGNANDTAYLGDRDATLSGGTSYAAGAVGSAVQFDGKESSAVTARNSVRTDASFSVAAWVKLRQADSRWYVAVSQDGDRGHGFALLYDGGAKKWLFSMPQSEQPSGWDGIRAENRPPAADVWTHLAATFDATTRQISMYVNGELVGTTQRNTVWHAPGALRVGGHKVGGQVVSPWLGGIDEVQVYDRVLGAAEVTAAVSRDNVQVGHWRFDDKDGATAQNSVEGGDSGVLNGGATFIDGGAVNRAVQLDGSDDHVAMSRPAVRTDQSFTAAAWVKANQFVTSGKSQTAVSQDGTHNSGFSLQYKADGQKWVFGRVTQDSTPLPPSSRIELAASQTPAVGMWTHLAGTFNATDRKMTIYVNGEYGGEVVLPAGAAWDATGPLTIGRAKFAGQPTDYWPGAIDEVRMYSRALTADELKGIFIQNNVTSGSWKLDGGTADDSTRARGGKVENGPAWVTGQTRVPDPADLALQLDGTDDYLHALNTVDTSQSFSVAAWVRPDKPGSNSTVVSQDGNIGSGFSITATGDGRWSFFVAAEDKVDPAGGRISTGSVQYGVWTHVAGVYSKQRKQIELYVNGVLIGSSPHLGGPNTTGELEIGRVKWNGQTNWTNYFAGAIDDVVVYNRPLFAEEAVAMAGRDLTLVHNWALDEGSGTTATDSIGARGGSLSNGPTYVPGKLGNAIHFDGVDDSVAVSGVDLRTDQNFSVSAWIWLDRANCTAACRQDAVSIDGGAGRNFSKLRLGRIVDDPAKGYGNWIFEMPEEDGRVTDAAVAVTPDDVGAWVFLTGVYDASSRKIWLYVNALRVDDGTVNTQWQATGGLRIGRATQGGAAVGFWPGSVDDVRLYSTLLDKDRISDLYHSYPAGAAAPALPVADAGQWDFDEGTATTAADSSGRNRPATLQGGAGWYAGRMGNTSWLDGAAGFADTTGPVLGTGQSFSVTAWAYLTKTGGGDRVVVAQDQTQASSFQLLYDGTTGRWAAAVAGTAGAAPVIVVRSGMPAQLGVWTNVGVVYDAALRQVRLYVNGVPSGAQVGVSVVDSNGRFSIGRGRRNNVNGSFFPGGVDDVRAFGRALSDGEVRKVHDSATIASFGRWTFEGSPSDLSWRKNPTALSATGASYTAGQSGQALQLDGRSGAMTTQVWGANPLDSFAVSAWARLSRTDQDATVLGQDGERTSGFLLQYNRNVGRWVFGAPVADRDGADFAYAYSPQAPVVDAWTHLTGVYDHAGRQFRLYVNGVLAGTRDNVQVAPAWDAFTIGRGRANGEPAGFFTGAIDDAQTELGIPTDEEIRTRAGFPAPAGGQFGRFYNSNTRDHVTVSSGGSHWDEFTAVPSGYRYEGSMGKLLAAEAPNTKLLYACRSGSDGFTSADPGCEGQQKLGELGWIYTQQPAGVATIAIYRCTMGF